MDGPDSDKVIAQIKEVVDETERRINHVNSVAEGLNIPSTNELRYAFNHLLKYLTGADKEAGLAKALRHSKRALYDCYEVEVLFFHGTFEQFEDDYRDEPLADIIPSIHEWRAHFEDIRDFVQNTERNNRDQYYEALKSKHDATRPIIRALKSARQEINTRRKIEQEKRDREIKILKWTIVGAVGVLMTLVVVVGIEIWKAKNEHSAVSTPTQAPIADNPSSSKSSKTSH